MSSEDKPRLNQSEIEKEEKELNKQTWWMRQKGLVGPNFEGLAEEAKKELESLGIKVDDDKPEEKG
jgi:hypothetical protein